MLLQNYSHVKKQLCINCVYVMYITTGYEVKNKPDGDTAACCFADQRFETRGGRDKLNAAVLYIWII